MTDRTVAPGRGDNLTQVYRLVVILTAVLVLIQAALAGRGMFLDPDLFEMHGMIGNVTFLAVIIQVGLAFAARRHWQRGGLALWLSGALLLLVITQLGLGYGGREAASAAAWHVANGVLIFGVIVASLTLTLTSAATRDRLS